VPDERLEKLLKIYQSKKIIPSTVSFVDIAGLVKGAAAGEGLGNQFLSHIREVNLILHVVRCFEDANVTMTQSTVDPIADYETIVTELLLKDIDSVEKRIAKVAQLAKAAKQKPKELQELEKEAALLEQIKTALQNGDAQKARALMTPAQEAITPLLVAKNSMFIANVAEDELEGEKYWDNPHVQKLVAQFGKEKVIPVCAKIESELSRLPDEEAQELMGAFGLTERGINRIIQRTFENLGLITFFTCGPNEIHAWPISKGTPIRQAAGEIHSDLERGFICAEVFNYRDLEALGSEANIRKQGKYRTEGQGYPVADGDIVLVKFNV
jgi:GTP-binding protein YchF